MAEVIGDAFMPLLQENQGRCNYFVYFQQENASRHTAKCTCEWFMEHVMAVFDWNVKPAGLNIIENLCFIPKGAVYKNALLKTVQDLKECILYER